MKPIEHFTEFLKSYICPTANELAQFLQIVSSQKTPKGKKLVKAGRICTKMCFLTSGFIKYTLIEKNKSTVIHIASKGKIISDFFSFYSGLPALTDIDTITDCDLITVEKKDLEQLYNSSKIWEHFGRKVAEQAVVQQILNRIHIQTLSPEERYLDIINSNPELLQVIKLGDLSQALGIRQETLSRIRNRIRK